jgi:hypothetical protein
MSIVSQLVSPTRETHHQVFRACDNSTMPSLLIAVFIDWHHHTTIPSSKNHVTRFGSLTSARFQSCFNFPSASSVDKYLSGLALLSSPRLAKPHTLTYHNVQEPVLRQLAPDAQPALQGIPRNGFSLWLRRRSPRRRNVRLLPSPLLHHLQNLTMPRAV